MTNRVSLKKIIIALIFITMGCLCVFGASAETTTYAGASQYEYTTRKPCPSFDMEAAFSNALQAETAKALRQWFFLEYAYRVDWYDILWNHAEQVLLEPYIIKTEYTDDYELMVYCSSAISVYALLEDTTGAQYFAQGMDAVGLFRVCFDTSIQGDMYALSVHRIVGDDEELFVGAGLGTDGFPGLSDQLAPEVPEWGLDTTHIAEKYLETNQLSAEVVAW